MNSEQGRDELFGKFIDEPPRVHLRECVLTFQIRLRASILQQVSLKFAYED